MTKLQILIDFIDAHPADIMWEAIHCDAKEKAEDLVAMFYALDYRWENDDLAKKHFQEDGTITTKWDEKGKNTCYSITPTKIILFGSKSFYQAQEKNIISYDEMFGEAEDFNRSIDNAVLLREFKEEEKTKTVKIEELEKRFCPQCGNPLFNNGEKFCMECGFKIPENFFIKEVPQEIPQPVPTNTQNVIQAEQPIPSDSVQQNPKELENFIQNNEIVQENQENSKNAVDILPKNKKSSSHLMNRLLIVLSIFIIVALGLFIAQYCVGNNMDNDYGKFSNSWERIELVTQSNEEDTTEEVLTENTESQTEEQPTE